VQFANSAVEGVIGASFAAGEIGQGAAQGFAQIGKFTTDQHDKFIAYTRNLGQQAQKSEAVKAVLDGLYDAVHTRVQ